MKTIESRLYNLKILDHKYPIELYSWTKSLGISAFIILFLLTFLPFGLKEIQGSSRTWIIFGYGLITFFALIFNQLLIPRVFPKIFAEETWSIRKQILWLIWNVIFIATMNFYYSTNVLSTSIHGTLFTRFLAYTFVISLFPITVSTILSYNRLLRKNVKNISVHNQNLLEKVSIDASIKSRKELNLFSSNKKDMFSVDESSIVYIESSANYVSIYILEDDILKKHTLRNTLKNIEKQLANHPYIMKTHKAFIVNLHHVINVNGNAQGYKLTLNYVSDKIPVSRTYLKSFDHLMRLIP